MRVSLGASTSFPLSLVPISYLESVLPQLTGKTSQRGVRAGIWIPVISGDPSGMTPLVVQEGEHSEVLGGVQAFAYSGKGAPGPVQEHSPWTFWHQFSIWMDP